MKHLTLLVLLAACGTTKDYRQQEPHAPEEELPKGIAPELQDTVKEWVNDCYSMGYYIDCDAARDTVDTYTVLDSYEDKDTVGRCNLFGYGAYITRRVVSVRRDILDEPNTLKTVFAHEMGHCAFLIDHTKDGLMAPYIPAEQTLEKKLGYMLRTFYAELFTASLPRIENYD